MASQFLEDSAQSKTGSFVAVFSQSKERAQTFAAKHELPHCYDDFALMMANPDIDAVYIASTHPNHAPQAIAALNAGKHVLVEKPMALSKEQTQQVFDAAKANGKLCCEALWTKFSPTYQSLMSQLASGKIGELRHIHANFGFAVDQNNPKQRLLNPNHAGGALLDIGLYPIFLALTLFGLPTKTKAHVHLGETGVDVAADLIMEYDGGRSASIAYRFDAMMPTKASISGSEGWVELESPFFCGSDLHWGLRDKPVQREHIELTNIGWGNEFEGVNNAIHQGKLETQEHTWEDSLQLAEYLEYLRTTWGPTYPFEH
jgi:predicted dehydrogenase